MNIQEWLRALPLYLVLFPAAASCYLPMQNQMKHPPAKTAALCLMVLVPYTLAAAWVQVHWRLHSNMLVLPSLALFFLLYLRTVKADLPRALAVFVGVCAMQTFPAQLASALDIYRHPQTWSVEISPEAALLQLGMACLMLGLAHLIRRQAVWMIDNLDFPRIWYSATALSAIFLACNVAASPNPAKAYYAGHPYRLFSILQVFSLALLVCACVLFYQGARLIFVRSQLEQRSQLLEMQTNQYLALQEYMHLTAQLRHDFRHSVRLLSTLAEQGNLAEIRSYLAEYEQNLSEHVTASYCANTTLNALLGYYHEMADAAGVETDWKVELPEPLTVSELDIANLFGNLIENGIRGCQTLPEGERYFSLTSEIRQGDSLYIVSTNSFDGRVIKGKNGYYSTKHRGRGIGLPSISVVAEKYGGTAQFSNSDKEFFVDVVIRI